MSGKMSGVMDNCSLIRRLSFGIKVCRFGPVDVRARWVDLKGYQVDGKFTNGAGNKVLCMPARGYSFAAGGENGPSDIPGMYEGMTRENFRINDDINKVD